MKIEKEFFYPNISGYLGNSMANAEEMKRHMATFQPTYEVMWFVIDTLWTSIEV